MKNGHVILWIPAVLMLASAAVFASWMMSKYTSGQQSFFDSCLFIIVMLSPIMVFAVAGRVKITKSVKDFGGYFNVFITTTICTAIVIVVNIIANLKWPAPQQIEPWEIYTYYVAISFGEEVYYRLVLGWGILALLSGKHKAIGITGAAAVTIIGFIGGFQAVTVNRAAWIGVSIMVFAVFYITNGRKNKEAPVWAVIVAVVISATTFSMAHWNVYHDSPGMLWALLIGGGVMAGFLIFTNNLFVPLMAHFANNLMSLRGVIINASVLVAIDCAQPAPYGMLVITIMIVAAVAIAVNSSFNHRKLVELQETIINNNKQ